MTWTMCFFVRDLATNRIVHHEIEETTSSAADRAKAEGERIRELMKQYPPKGFEVFVQGFSSQDALYRAWPELRSA